MPSFSSGKGRNRRTAAAALAVAVAAVSFVAGADAVVPENGPIVFVSSRAPDPDFNAEIYSVAADGTGRTNLTRNPAPDVQPAVSRDGDRIAFVSYRDGYSAVYVMNADGSDQHRVVNPVLATRDTISRPVWSPTGRTLVFAINRHFEGSLYHVVDLATGRMRTLGGPAHAGVFAFSPDGRFAAYQVGPDRNNSAHVVVVRVATGAARNVSRGYFAGWAPRGHSVLVLRPFIRSILTVDPSGRRRWALRGVRASAATWSPNGRRIAFLKHAGKQPGLYTVRLGGRRPQRLVALASASLFPLDELAWSPDGTWLAFSVVERKASKHYFVRSNGRGLRRVLDASSPPVWSRNARHLAFIGTDGTTRIVSPPANSAARVSAAEAVYAYAWARGDRLLYAAGLRRHLFAVEQDGTGVRRVAPDAAPVGRISPDGAHVAFIRDDDIWTARLDGSNERQLTSGPDRDLQPAWSPDGRWIAFGREPDQGGISAADIFIVGSDGGVARQLTFTPFGDYAASPTWSPDGTRIAFLTSSGGLFVLRPDGSGLHRISTLEPQVYFEADWSPDGTRLALGGRAIAVVNSDGSGFRALTGPGWYDGQTSWAPDGSKIVFVRSAGPFAGVANDTDLWTVSADGSREKRLTGGQWPDTLPSWQPVRP